MSKINCLYVNKRTSSPVHVYRPIQIGKKKEKKKKKRVLITAEVAHISFYM